MQKLIKWLPLTLFVTAIIAITAMRPAQAINSEVTSTRDSLLCIPLDSIIDSVPEPYFLDKPAKECLMDGLIFHNIHHPEIVYAQAILETGAFRSSGCRNKNNLFGLMKKGKLRRFSHWNESIICYKERIQSRYREGEDYYAFLKRIHYAEDPTYVDKLRQIVRKNRKNWEAFYQQHSQPDTALLNG